jgi:hypothetical protein
MESAAGSKDAPCRLEGVQAHHLVLLCSIRSILLQQIRHVFIVVNVISHGVAQ